MSATDAMMKHKTKLCSKLAQNAEIVAVVDLEVF